MMIPDSESFIKIIPPSAWDEKANHSQLAGLLFFLFFISIYASHRVADARKDPFLILDRNDSYMLGKIMLIKNN